MKTFYKNYFINSGKCIELKVMKGLLMNADIKENLVKHFKTSQSIPFLFIGSGFSRRYLKIENWENLLRKFCEHINPFEYYFSRANKNLPKVASLMASDFHEAWWKSGDYKNYFDKYQDSLTTDSSALKISIASYIQEISMGELFSEDYAEELQILPTLTIDGIITTNWDRLLEKIFLDYKVYIGQEELLFSNPQSIGEIYKIHGCCTKPNSLVLTDEDYLDFNDKNAYLAAKLITIFVEHPVIFIGYSLSDENIRSLLRAIVNCLKPNDLDKIRNNLIFVQWSETEGKEEILDTFTIFDHYQVPVKVVTTSSFLPVYEALAETKRKIPVKVLRSCKEQLYELIRDNDPIGKICVCDINDIEDKNNIEFVIGIGVSRDKISDQGYSQKPMVNISELKEASSDIISEEMCSQTPMVDISKLKEVSSDIISERGYSGLTDSQVISFFLDTKNDYNSYKLLKQTLPEKAARTPYLPVYKFLREQDINSEDDYISSEFKCDRIDKIMKITLEDCKTKNQSILSLSKNVIFQRKKFNKLVAEYPSNISKVLEIIPTRDNNLRDKDEIDEILEFLRNNISLIEKNNSKTLYKKSICCMDRILYSWK